MINDNASFGINNSEIDKFNQMKQNNESCFIEIPNDYSSKTTNFSNTGLSETTLPNIGNKVMIIETYADYVIKANARDHVRDKWIYDILDGTRETDRVIYRNKYFLLIPSLCSSNVEPIKFHLLCFATNTSIKSLRDLTEENIPLLKYMYKKTMRNMSRHHRSKHSTRT